MARWLAHQCSRGWVRLYVENDRESRSDDLIRTLAALGYDLYRHRPPLYNADNFLGNPENVFTDIISSNLLGVPRISAVVIEGSSRVVPSER